MNYKNNFLNIIKNYIPMAQTVFQDGIVIYADDRDDTRIIAILEKKCTVRRKRLDFGDYLLSKDVIAERKTSDDFLSSIVDGRLFRQLSELKEHYQCPVLIIEGKHPLKSSRNIHPNAVRGALASIATDYALPILWSENQLETAEILFTIAKREQGEKKSAISIRNKTKRVSANREQEFLICGLPNISTVTAKRLLKHFGSPEKVFLASESELKKVPGIGDKMAKSIRKILTKNYEVSILEE